MWDDKLRTAHRSETAQAIQRIKQEIDVLRREQSEALNTAVYFGMSRKEHRENDERREKSKKLVDQLSRLVEELARSQSE